MVVWTAAINERSLGASSTARVELAGQLGTAANDFIVPTNARGVIAAACYISDVTPTAGESTLASMSIVSPNLRMDNWEVLAEPISSGLSTQITPLGDAIPRAKYPLMYPAGGGERMQVYGQLQVSRTAAPFMGATVWLTDDSLPDTPYAAQIGGGFQAAASTTSTGTTANTSVTGATISIAAGIGGLQRVIRGYYGFVGGTTLASVKPTTGYYQLTAPELDYPLTYSAEPIFGTLTGAIDTSFTHLTRVDEVAVGVNTPTTITGLMAVGQAPSTLANFAQGILYQ